MAALVEIRLDADVVSVGEWIILELFWDSLGFILGSFWFTQRLALVARTGNGRRYGGVQPVLAQIQELQGGEVS